MTERAPALTAMPERYAERAAAFDRQAYFRADQVAFLCDVSPAAVQQAIRERSISVLVLPGGAYRISRKDIGLPPMVREQPTPVGVRVYFAISADYRVKIGISTDVPKRIAGLQSGGGIAVRLLGVIDGDHRTELALHKRFAAYRLLGEWFEPRDKLRQYLHDLFGPFETGFKR